MFNMEQFKMKQSWRKCRKNLKEIEDHLVKLKCFLSKVLFLATLLHRMKKKVIPINLVYFHNRYMDLHTTSEHMVRYMYNKLTVLLEDIYVMPRRREFYLKEKRRIERLEFKAELTCNELLCATFELKKYYETQ